MIDFNLIVEKFPAFLGGADGAPMLSTSDGLQLTLELLFLSLACGLLLAVPLALMRVSKNRVVAGAVWLYTYVFRGTPLLVQLFLVYYGLAQFDIVRHGPLWPYLRDPYWCTVITMTMHTAAYIAEILRGAIQAVPPGEIEAARALGMSRAQAMLYIILPRAARIGLPAYSNEVILMLKASALASTVTLLELTGMSRTIIARTYLPVEIFFAAGVFYLVIAYVMVRAFKLLERMLRVDACQGR